MRLVNSEDLLLELRLFILNQSIVEIWRDLHVLIGDDDPLHSMVFYCAPFI